jgi:hypothetical protein
MEDTYCYDRILAELIVHCYGVLVNYGASPVYLAGMHASMA